MSPQNDLDLKIDAIGKLLNLFKLERLIYAIVTIISLIVLLSCAIFLLKDHDSAKAIGLFGSSGAITFTLGRLLKMWNDALNILSLPVTSSK
ncbi:hypothetical protein [Hymenobacter bucti]|uniref:Uncharacterized protein n=1 Tax=Hymenobacter bucti TaxID=1844114 RepID=A0ABW4QZR2_9BACT